MLCFSDFHRGQRNDKPLTSLASPRFEMLSEEQKTLAWAQNSANWLNRILGNIVFKKKDGKSLAFQLCASEEGAD
jgi:hypothetical protein